MGLQRVQDQNYLYLSWDKMGEICFSLAKKILESQKNYDRLVALAKGGWTWARTMADYLAIHKVASVQYEFYTQVAKTKEYPTLKQSLPVSVEGERLLIFDDVADSGKTLKAATDYLKKCGAASISTATLFYKPQSKIKPDFYSKKTCRWVIFPHEIRETIAHLSEEWMASGMGEKEIKDNFRKIGLPEEQVEYFMNGGDYFANT
jgi:hypoxanthine phosphoribosyltransferase